MTEGIVRSSNTSSINGIGNYSYEKSYGVTVDCEPDYLDQLEESRRTYSSKLPTTTSQFWDEVNQYTIELEREVNSQQEDKFILDSSRRLWKLRRRELQKLKEELREVKDSDAKDETKLLETCNTMAAQEKAKPKLKSIAERANKGELQLNRVYMFRTLMTAFEKERQEAILTNDKLKLEIESLNQKLKQTEHLVAQAKMDLKQVDEQFGGIIRREIHHKEKAMREEFDQREKELHQDFGKNLKIQMDKKEDEMSKLMEEIDKYKDKNVEWIKIHAKDMEAVHQFEKENKKISATNRSVLQQFMNQQNENTQLHVELSRLKKEYSEIYIAYKKLNSQVNSPHDLKGLPSPFELQQRFNKFVAKPQETMNS